MGCGISKGMKMEQEHPYNRPPLQCSCIHCKSKMKKECLCSTYTKKYSY